MNTIWAPIVVIITMTVVLLAIVLGKPSDAVRIHDCPAVAEAIAEAMEGVRNER